MIAIIGMDYHISSQRLEVGQKLMRSTTQWALENKAQYVILVGDLLDERFGVKVEVLQLVWNELAYSLKKGVPWIWCRGNHECPVKSQPHKTIMSLFSGICHPVISPAIWQLDDAVLFFLPWYPTQEYIEYAANMSRTARSYRARLKLLLSHIGLDEGKASPSNMYVRQAVSLKHLEEEAYDRVILGDYHHRQALSQRTFYGGCPISHQHGDDPQNGVWLLNTATNELTATSLLCEGSQEGVGPSFPVHRTWHVQDPHCSVLAGYGARDCNRIYVDRDWVSTYQTLYPDAQIIGTGDEPDGSARRLSEVKHKTPEAIWHHYCDLKGRPIPERELGLALIGEAAGRIQTRGV